jgi:hypothetical protein
MRHTLNAIDPLPAFPSDGLSFEQQDSEPAYQPCERHKRLPSYREVCEARGEAKWLREVMQYRARNGSTSWDSKQLYFQLDTFNGNCNPEITEADCRQSKSAPAEAESEQAAFERWAALECPSGDVESVQYQWARSDARAEWLESQQESPAEQPKQSTEPAPQEPQADADGWVEWDASTQGRPPLSADSRIALRISDGSVVWESGLRVRDANWALGSTIRAYRIVA